MVKNPEVRLSVFRPLCHAPSRAPTPAPVLARCISDTKFILSRNEEQRLKNLAKGSDEDDYESRGEEESDGDNRKGDDDQPTLFKAGLSRSGRRVTRFVL